MSVGTDLCVDEEAVEESEAECERALVRRDVLRRARSVARGVARAEYCERGVAVGARAVAATFHVAEDLIVGAVLFDYVDDVLDGRAACEELFTLSADEAVVAHDCQRVAREVAFDGFRQSAYVADDEGGAVLASLPAAAARARVEAVVREVRRAARIVDDDGRVLKSGSLPVADVDDTAGDGDRRRILPRGDEAAHG